MAAYFHGGSEIQADGLQTLYLMNPNYVGYTDTQQPPANMLFMNSSAARNGLHPGSHLHTPPPNGQHFEGVPLQVTATAVEPTNQDDASRLSVHTQQEVPVLHGIGVIPRFQYNLWGSADQTSTGNHQHIPPAVSVGCGNHAMDVASQLGFLKQVVSPTTQQGLSLTLSSQQPGYRSLASNQDLRVQLPAGFISPRSGDELRCSGGGSSSVSAVSTGISCMQSVIMSSKYLKAAQLLLDEFVHVGKGMKAVMDMARTKETMKMNKETLAFTSENASGEENSTKREIELPTAQRHELQMNKAKLGNMLDEVKQRYRQYHHQMQIVVTAFEQVAGIGSAKSYTHLALQTISKQFRCLKDAISSQIKATSKRLGEEDSLEGQIGRSRLKFVDHQLRQQRALQQLGMMQQNAWRAQRGLPERAVSVLRAWLFEHFLHPYPKDSDKHTLAKQTGLTKSQVSNWFINARVRLWKPMVEEMYTEEMKENEKNNVTEESRSKCDQNKESGSKSSVPKESSGFQMDENSRLQSKQAKLMNQNHASPQEISTCSMTTSPTAGYFHAQAGFSFMGSTNFDGISQRSPKKLRSSDMLNSAESILPIDMDMKSGETNKGLLQDRESYPMMEGTATHHGNGFGTYTIGELGRFNPDQLAAGYQGSGVSLTLGLPHTENNNLSSLSRNQQSYLSNQNIHLGSRHEMGTVETHYSGINTTPQASHSNTTSFETINNIQNRKNFASQLLPDFVA